jgi:glycosyltransferase involved in cell wall biosynthesis
MTIVAYTALHYGRDYLHHAIRSIIDDVDSYIVLYTPVGSHGHRTDILCPDTRAELYDIAYAAEGDKLRWFDGEWPYEGAQRDSIFAIAPEADVIVVLDADEIWPPGLLKMAIEGTHHWHRRDIRLPMVHYWRSFWRAILHDPAYPVRLIYPHIKAGAETFTPNPEIPLLYRTINHLGYAQRSEIVRYKLQTHGHKNEFRRDCDWFTDIFMNTDRATDLHPVGSEYWNRETIDVPDFLLDHPFAKLSVIE